MTQDIFASKNVGELRTERAQRAVRAFRAMQPGLTGYARAITGRKDVVVELAQGAPRTDGRKIYFKPPIALGDLTPHDRHKCERRDRRTKLMLCPACRVREEVLISIYHEIAHIVFGTFEKPSEQAKIEALERAIAEVPSKYAQRMRETFSRIPDYKKNDYLNLSSLISPFLPVLVNSLEDARVDEGMFKARKGTKVMFDAFVQSIFNEGFEADDGTKVVWAEKPLNSQVLIGVFVLACKYNYEGWFHSDVEAALSDERLRELVGRMETVRSAQGSYNLAFPILARLRELGFCKQPDEPEDEEEDEGEDEGQQDETETSDESDEHDSGQSETSAEDAEDGEDASDSGDGESTQPSDESDGDNEGDGESPSGSSPDATSDDDDTSEATPEGDDAEGDPNFDGGLSDESTEAEPTGTDDAESSDGGEDSQEEGDQADGMGDSAGDGSGEPDDSSGDDNLDDSRDSSDPSQDEGDADEDVEPVDSGADKGEGGTESTDPEYGTPSEALADVKVFSQHDTEEPVASATVQADDEALDIAIMQGEYFEKPSANVAGVREHKYGIPILENGRDMSSGWRTAYGDHEYYAERLKRLGINTDLDIPESALGPALIEMRRTFSDNQRAAHQRHLRSGKINARVLGKRAWANDERLFQKKRFPGKRSYAVLIGIDISGSTVGLNIALAKRAAMAQAELCHRMGVDFAIYAHTANGSWVNRSDLYLDVYEIKSFDAAWDGKAKEALSKINADSENLDGHGVEYYRKMVERHPATDKIILYYSDGKMPAANYVEELEILQREIAYCKKNLITLMGVGIRTDSPRRHGLNTVQVNDDSDVPKVIRHLQSALLHHR